VNTLGANSVDPFALEREPIAAKEHKELKGDCRAEHIKCIFVIYVFFCG
jgi:hypothetical protein